MHPRGASARDSADARLQPGPEPQGCARAHPLPVLHPTGQLFGNVPGSVAERPEGQSIFWIPDDNLFFLDLVGGEVLSAVELRSRYYEALVEPETDIVVWALVNAFTLSCQGRWSLRGKHVAPGTVCCTSVATTDWIHRGTAWSSSSWPRTVHTGQTRTAPDRVEPARRHMAAARASASGPRDVCGHAALRTPSASHSGNIHPHAALFRGGTRLRISKKKGPAQSIHARIRAARSPDAA